MKHFLILLFIPFGILAQKNDFETRYFKIDANSLPELQDVSSFSLYSQPAPFKNTAAVSFGMNEKNFREPVNMVEAAQKGGMFIDSRREVTTNLAERYGFSSFKNYGLKVEVNDNLSPVRNNVYQDMRTIPYQVEYANWRFHTAVRRSQNPYYYYGYPY